MKYECVHSDVINSVYASWKAGEEKDFEGFSEDD